MCACVRARAFVWRKVSKKIIVKLIILEKVKVVNFGLIDYFINSKSVLMCVCAHMFFFVLTFGVCKYLYIYVCMFVCMYVCSWMRGAFFLVWDLRYSKITPERKEFRHGNFFKKILKIKIIQLSNVTKITCMIIKKEISGDLEH